MTEIGSTLGGRYRLLELLGQGGMATIYRARDAQLERDVAIKLLRPELGQDPDFLARFRDEARAAASLSHPNIVAVHDFGEDASGPFIVMELVDGEDLGAILRDNGALAPRQAARIAAEVAKALHAAHVRGIVHRDVKPSNVLISRDGRVKVADFGIARAVTESALTMPGTTMGSVHYFSPEQARGEPATVASDVYSLGIVLYETLTGQRPFSGDGAAAVALARLTSTPPRPSALRPGIPAALDTVVQRAMALEPDQRFASAAAMASALEAFLAEPAPARGTAGAAPIAPEGTRTVAAASARPNQPVPYPPDAYAGRGTPPLTPASGRAVPPPPPPEEPIDEEPSGAGPWAWIAGILGLLILAIVGFLVFQLLTGGGTPSASPSPAPVTVPSFVGMTLAQAEAAAAEAGLRVTVAGSEVSEEAPDTVLSQDPAANASVAPDTEVRLILARGPDSVAVPDLRGKTEAEALQLIVTQNLAVGPRTEDFDDLVPAGSVVDQEPGPGILVAPGTVVSYVVSLGPEPTPSPTPSPTPTPTPSPTPTPTPTPPPTPTPTPAPINVGDYRCMTLAEATSAITGDGFAVGTIASDPAGQDPIPADWIVIDQAPNPGQKRPAGTAIDLVFASPDTPCPP